MKIECPEGSGNYLNIYWAKNGDLQISMECRDCTGMKFTGSVSLYGLGKNGITPQPQMQLLEALAKFADTTPIGLAQ